MWHEWVKGYVHEGFWCGNVRDNLEDTDVDERIILE